MMTFFERRKAAYQAFLEKEACDPTGPAGERRKPFRVGIAGDRAKAGSVYVLPREYAIVESPQRAARLSGLLNGSPL